MFSLRCVTQEGVNPALSFQSVTVILSLGVFVCTLSVFLFSLSDCLSFRQHFYPDLDAVVDSLD